MPSETYNWNMTARVLKYTAEDTIELGRILGREPLGADFEYFGADPYGIVEVEGNALVDAGKQRISDLITGNGSPTAFTAIRGVTGVGNSSTATTGGMTALQGSGGNQYYKAVDGAPGSVTGSITAAATFGPGLAEFSWEEWCWAIATATPVASASFATATTSGVMLNRKVQSLGAKGVGSGVTWVHQATATQA